MGKKPKKTKPESLICPDAESRDRYEAIGCEKDLPLHCPLIDGRCPRYHLSLSVLRQIAGWGGEWPALERQPIPAVLDGVLHTPPSVLWRTNGKVFRTLCPEAAAIVFGHYAHAIGRTDEGRFTDVFETHYTHCDDYIGLKEHLFEQLTQLDSKEQREL